MNTANAWTWSASGKHPVVKDFIRIGAETPAAITFSRWVEEGYAHISGHASMHSWRFFARGAQPRELVCGLLRDSFDGAGRPFPFLIVGAGKIEGWEKHWVNLHEVLDSVWERLEFLGTRRLSDLAELKADVSRLPSPVFQKDWQPARIPEVKGASFDAQEGMLAMSLKGTGDHSGEIVHGLMALEARSSSAPDAVFIGGPLERPFLVAFTRQINAADFGRLWEL